MKNAFKKLAAVAMAFTMLGTGTAVTKTIAPQANNSITAYAASCTNCHGGSYYVRSVVSEHVENITYGSDRYGQYVIFTIVGDIVYICDCCGSYCGHEKYGYNVKKYY